MFRMQFGLHPPDRVLIYSLRLRMRRKTAVNAKEKCFLRLENKICSHYLNLVLSELLPRESNAEARQPLLPNTNCRAIITN